VRNPSGEESGEEIFLEILKLKSFKIWISSGMVTGNMVKLDDFLLYMDLQDLSGNLPEKVHTPIGLFIG
jgi:hypothetical protein